MDKQYIPEKKELKGVLEEFREALEEEIDKIKKSGQSSTLLYSGKQIESHCAEFWYRFKIEYIPAIPADSPCKLLIGKEQFDVIVISYEESSIVISSKVQLPDSIGKARLENGATVLMELLIKCIENCSEQDNFAGNRMLPQEDGSIYRFNQIFSYNDLTFKDNNTQRQNDAITAALSNDITYIWGPPGTGKTTVISQIIDELYKHGRSVLVVSHTNTAVDGAIEKADKTYFSTHNDSDECYPILRIGIPVKPLPDRVMLSNHIAVLGKELYKQKTLLEQQQIELQFRLKEICLLLDKEKWVRSNKLDLIRDILLNIASQEQEIVQIQDEIKEINCKIEAEKSANPECTKYLALSKKMKEKKGKYSNLCGQVIQLKISVDSLSDKIRFADDEIRKHELYADLCTKEKKYMSVQFQKNELSKITAKIKSINDDISSNKEKLTEAKRIIANYNNRGVVAKFFSGKEAVTQAQKQINSLSVSLLEAEEELHRQQSLGEEVREQLEKHQNLLYEINAVAPSNTKDYWEEELHELNIAYSSTKEELSNFTIQKNSIYYEISELEKRLQKSKKSFDLLNDLGRNKNQKQSRLSTITDSLAQDNKYSSELIETEKSFCEGFFYKLSADSKSALLEELYKLLSQIKSEIDAVDLSAIKAEEKKADNELKDITHQLALINQDIQDVEKQAIMSAKIVGATLAKSYLSETLRARKFDTVILDEASMASIPALWCASCLAESSLVIVGDFLQLPPIVMAETPMAKKWLGKDIFYHSGMQELARDKSTCPKNFVMLNDQFRMESDIADVANMYYGEYGGLCSHDFSEFRDTEREQFYKWYPGKRTKHNIHLIDTKNLHAWVTGVPQGKSHSRLNCFSASVDVDLAFKLLDRKLAQLNPEHTEPVNESSVLIVAPYKPHIKQIDQLIELEYKNRGFKENLNYIRAGTIHSFQGSEADIVIFDLVIDEPHWKANLFMTDKEVNEGLRKMFNVAITRAKFKLFIVGNFDYCQSRAKNNALAELLDKLLKKEHLEKIDAKEILPDIAFARDTASLINGVFTDNSLICREESFNDYFMADIQSFKKRLIIYSPFITENRLSVLLPAFSDAINAGKHIVVITKALSDRGKTEVSRYQKCENQLKQIGVRIIHKKGMHEKLVFVDNKVIWIGSLNVLSFTGLTGEVMQRHASNELVEQCEKLFDIEHICEVVENSYEQKCPICSSEMIVKDSAEGNIYWDCSEGDYSRNIDQQYPVDGILRCKCGATYVFSMKNEPRWVCSKDSSHYQRMRESDLKLEKMAELIEKKSDRKKVEEYFAKKRKEREAKKKDSQQKKKSTDNKTKKTNKKDTIEQVKFF